MKVALIAARMIDELINLRAELIARGHEVIVPVIDQLTPEDFTGGAIKNVLADCDLVYYRSGFTTAGSALLPQLFAGQAGRLVNRVVFDPLASNKLHQAMMALEAGVKIPPTFMGRGLSFETLAAGFGLPFIAKAAHGIQGAKVFLIREEEDYDAALAQISGDVVWQRFIKNSGDYRVFMLAGEAYQIFRRVAAPGNFKNNMSLGAHGEPVEDAAFRARLAAISKAVTDKMEIEIGGIDIIEESGTGELYFLEANINPGWKGLDATLGTNTAAVLADYFEARASSSSTRSL